ncbi:Hpt domain-containing protein [bacterium]|nr:Hpt domain-containing protein [bacterium]
MALPEIPPVLQKAFMLFCDEFAQHEKIFTAALNAPEQMTALLEQVRQRLHTIRGGAGFFQLNEIVDSSKAGELLIKSLGGAAPSPEQLQEISGHVQKVLALGRALVAEVKGGAK